MLHEGVADLRRGNFAKRRLEDATRKFLLRSEGAAGRSEARCLGRRRHRLEGVGGARSPAELLPSFGSNPVPGAVVSPVEEVPAISTHGLRLVKCEAQVSAWTSTSGLQVQKVKTPPPGIEPGSSA